MRVRKSSVKNILITGATGLLGSQLLALILAKSDAHVFVLGRGNSVAELANRVEVTLRKCTFIRLDKKIIRKRIKFLVGEITMPRLDLSKVVYSDLVRSIDQIYHMAALTNFNASQKELMLVNFEGTRNVLEFARKCKISTSVEYISSIYVVGKYMKTFSEDNLWQNQKFNNSYEYSKMMAELLVKEKILEGLRVNVYRPGVIVGESRFGRVINPGMLYHFFRLIRGGLMDVFPFDRKARINIIPSDVAAKIIYSLSNLDEYNKVYHVIPRNELVLADVMKIAFDFYDRAKGRVVSPVAFGKFRFSPVAQMLWAPFMPYLRFHPKLSAKSTQVMLRKINMGLPVVKKDFIRRILSAYEDNLTSSRYILTKGA